MGTRSSAVAGFAASISEIRRKTDASLQCAGALQLLPDNATKWIRFARFVEAIRAVRPAHRQVMIDNADLESVLTRPPVADGRVLAHEDPFEGPFVAPVLFEDREYLVLPGAVADAATVCQFLVDAINELPASARSAQRSMRRDAARLLWVSDEVARRAGLVRWQAPVFDTSGGVHIPDEKVRRHLESAVCIHDADLRQFGGVRGFRDLCWPAWPTRRLPLRRDPRRLTDDRALVYPLSRAAAANALIVPSPNQLALSLVHRIAAWAARYDVRADLMAAFERLVLAEAERLCGRMQWMPLGSSSLYEAVDNIRDAVFAFDVDKIAHVVVLADDLSGYEVAKPHAAVDAAPQLRRIKARMQQVREAAEATCPGSHVFHLVVAASISRPMHGDFASLEDECSSLLLLSIDELRTVVDHERNDPLGMWRFAVGRRELPLDNSVSTVADAYALYLECDKRPRRVQGGDRPVVLLLIGYGARMQVRHRQRADVHAAQLPFNGEVVMVQRATEESAAPVYVAQHEDLSHLRLVELALPVWVGAYGANVQSHAFCAAIANAVAHHLWRLRETVDAFLRPIAADTPNVVIDIADPDASALMFRDPDNTAGLPWFQIDTEPSEHLITVRLLPNATAHLARVDEHAEGTLIVELIRTLRELTDQPSDHETAEVNDVAAAGLPRFMHASVGDVPGVHGGDDLPNCRLRHQAELDKAADEIDTIASSMGLEFGPVPLTRRAVVIDTIVRTLHSRLRARLRELDPAMTFEFLVSEQERMQHDRTRLLVVPPSPFVDEDEYIRTSVETFHKINQSATASRFLLETAVHCVRDGQHPLSYSRYDELLATTQHLVAFGSMGDALRCGLSDIELHFREPGRLVVGASDPLHDVVYSHLDTNARAPSSQDLLAEWARFTASRDVNEPLDQDEASTVFEIEYGVPLRPFLGAIERLHELASGTGLSVTTAPISHLRDDLMTATALTAGQTTKTLEMLSMRAEPGEAPPDLSDPRFTPWRFSRENSYLRRPLLVHDCGPDGTVATWGAQSAWLAAEALFEQIGSGRLKAKTPAMKKYIGQHRNRVSDAFENEVADIARNDPLNAVEVGVMSLGSTALKRPNGEQLGDIDVLVVNEHCRIIWIIEAKCFATARTAREIKGEIDKLTDGDNPTILHHSERVRFVQDRWSDIHRQMKLPGSDSDWQIRDMVVTSAPSIAASLLQHRGTTLGTTIIPIEELSEQLTS